MMTRARTQRTGSAPFKAGADRDRRDRPVHLPGRSRSSPTRSRARTRSTRSSRAPTACSPARSCGSRASTSARCRASRRCPGCKLDGVERHPAAVLGRRRDDDDRRQRAAAPQGRDLLRSARGSSSRATSSSTSARARPRRRSRRRLHVPDPAGHRAGPVRPGADLAAGRHAPQPPDPAAAVRQGGQAGRPGVQRVDPVLAAGVRVLGRSSRHDALGIQPHDLSNWIATQGDGRRGALDAHPQNLQSLITDFNTTANAFARAERRAPERGRRAAADAGGGDPGVQRAERRVPAARERSPGR